MFYKSVIWLAKPQMGMHPLLPIYYFLKRCDVSFDLWGYGYLHLNTHVNGDLFCIIPALEIYQPSPLKAYILQ